MASDLSASHKIESARFIVLGNVDAGKSSFISVMTNKILDDGNGAARQKCASGKDELDTGRTSKHKPNYLVAGNEILTLIDLCGHEKYLKTTIYGITALYPHFAILTVGANMGLNGMADEHIRLLIARRIPFMIIITKVDDICPDHVLQKTMDSLNTRLNLYKKKALHVEDLSTIPQIFQEAVVSFDEQSAPIVPIVKISNKTGLNIDEVRQALCQIKSRTYLESHNIIPKKIITTTYPGVFYPDTIFNVKGVGLVLSGTNKYAPITLGQKLFLGPVSGEYLVFTVKSIHNSVRENVSSLSEDEAGSIGIRFTSAAKHSYTRSMFKKGQVAVADLDFAKKHTTRKFNAVIRLPNHGTTIKHGYQSTIHCRTTRQAARLLTDDPEKSIPVPFGKNVNVTFQFLKRQEFILPETSFIFRDGKTKGFGRVLAKTEAKK
jgi:elongation factor 1-alpha